MRLLVFLLGSVVLAAATENDTGNPGIFINHSKMLVTIVSPPIDLDLSSRGIRSLYPLAFNNCASVRTLDLSSNWIKGLPPEVFSSMSNLSHLSLAYNELSSKAMVGAFRNLTNLKSLDITHNPLSKILKDETFAGLPESCEIYVRGWKNLRTMTPRVFGKTEKNFPKNQTPAGESKNCTQRLGDLQELFDYDKVRTREMYYSDDVVKMCTDNTTLRFVDFSNATETHSPNCHPILINENGKILYMEQVKISSFDNGWFRMRNTSVNAIYINGHPFYLSLNVTSDLLNDLPENIKVFGLWHAEIHRLNKGVMANEHLRDLSLRYNAIEFIEKDAFAGLKLIRLDLGGNSLVTLDYVSTLPKTLLWLNLDNRSIREILGNTFSQQKNLLILSLYDTRIRELKPPALDGLVSLQRLDLSRGKIKYVRSGVFRDLTKLRSLNLNTNSIELFDKGSFNGLGCLAELDVRRNRLQSLDGGVFDGLTDSLEVLNLSENVVQFVGSGTFVGAPKFNLSLQENNIRKMEKGAFDLPYLTNLDLRHNDLSTIEKGVAKRLGNLADTTEIKLGFNPLERLENGALAGVSSKARVSFAMTPIKFIQAGVFDEA